MGQSDIELSEEGVQEAAEVMHALPGFSVDFVVSSPLKRCLSTIAPFRAVNDCEFKVDDKWAERSWGIYEGLPKSRRGTITEPDDGEAEDAFRERVLQAIQALPVDRQVLVVSHSGVYREICKLGYVANSDIFTLPHAIPILLRRPDDASL